LGKLAPLGENVRNRLATQGAGNSLGQV